MLDAMGTPINSSYSHLDSTTVSLMNESQKSPDLFESDEDNNDEIEIPSIPEDSFETSTSENEILKRKCDIRDERRNKIMRMTLAGVPPPPKFTIPQYSAAEMLEMFRTNEKEMLAPLEEISDSQKTKSSEVINELKILNWPESLDCEYYDVYYNRGQVSSDLETLCDKYRVRYVGCETSSTVIDKTSNNENLTGSAKKKAKKHPWNYSPGRRLSHLARRRQIFTSANIAKAVVGNRMKSSLGADSRKMFFVDKKKPVNNFMSRSKLANLSSSIASTSSAHQIVSKSKQNIMTSSQMPSLKRALFQSPDLSSKFQNNPYHNNSSGLISKETPRTDKNKARRALFSSGTKKDGKTPNKKTPNKKTPRKTPRKTPNKTTPTSSRKKTPRKCLFADPDDGTLSARNLFNANGKRMRSESLQNLAVNDNAKKICLSSDEKKKLLWVVYHCLKEKKISSRNEIYKSCQNYLYRVCSDAWKNQKEDASLGNNKITNVSEKMLNIARKYVSGVILKVKNKSFYNKTQTSDLTSECGESTQQKDFDDKSSVQGSSVCEKSDCGKSECSVKLNTDQSSSSYHGDDDTNTTGSAYLNQDENSMMNEDTNMSEVASSLTDEQILNTEKLAQFRISCNLPPAASSVSHQVSTVDSETYPPMPTLVAEPSYTLPKLSSDALPESIPTLIPEVRSSLPVLSVEMPSLSSFCPEIPSTITSNFSQHLPNLSSVLPNFGSEVVKPSNSPSNITSELSPSCTESNLENNSLISNTPDSKKKSPFDKKFQCAVVVSNLVHDEDTRF